MARQISRDSRTVLCGLAMLLLAVAASVTCADDETPSQTSSNQLNQLILSDVFETTPNKNAAGEGYVSGEFRFLKFPDDVKQYLFDIKASYGITDQITVGGWVPIYNAKIMGGASHAGLGDITFFGQYKFDQIINPDIVNVTAQLDVVLPTGSRTRLRDSGKFGVRPLIEAYKDFGPIGPGNLGVYALAGTTITTDPDVRLGLAATYEYEHVIGILEFDDLAGDKRGRPLITISPGIAFRGFKPFELTLGFPFGANDASPDWGVVFKVTWALQK